MSGKVILLSGAPGVGKTTCLKELVELLKRQPPSGAPVIVLDNEDVFTRDLRVTCSEKSGLALDSREFAVHFNRTGQLAYQALCRKLAGQGQGFTVVMPGPFENLTTNMPVKKEGTEEEETLPLLRLMERQFERKIEFFQLLLLPQGETVNSGNVMDLESMLPIEQEVQNRLQARDDRGGVQSALDADKVSDPQYYRKRLRQQLLTAEMFPDKIKRVVTHLGDDPAIVAAQLYNAMLKG
jgi:energy-coupling factor transporter ATP-binding protein EcfA2